MFNFAFHNNELDNHMPRDSTVFVTDLSDIYIGHSSSESYYKCY